MRKVKFKMEIEPAVIVLVLICIVWLSIVPSGLYKTLRSVNRNPWFPRAAEINNALQSAYYQSISEVIG